MKFLELLEWELLDKIKQRAFEKFRADNADKMNINLEEVIFDKRKKVFMDNDIKNILSNFEHYFEKEKIACLEKILKAVDEIL